MIPANRRRNQRNKLQQQRSRNGKQWEEDLCEELNAAPQQLGPLLAQSMGRPAF